MNDKSNATDFYKKAKKAKEEIILVETGGNSSFQTERVKTSDFIKAELSELCNLSERVDTMVVETLAPICREAETSSEKIGSNDTINYPPYFLELYELISEVRIHLLSIKETMERCEI